MRDLATSGMTMIVVTHEMGFAREVGDTLVFMDDGVVVETGPPRDVLSNPQHERTRAFLSGGFCDPAGVSGRGWRAGGGRLAGQGGLLEGVGQGDQPRLAPAPAEERHADRQPGTCAGQAR